MKDRKIDGMNWHSQTREMFRGLVFAQIKDAEPNGVSLTDIHAANEAHGTKTQMHRELQAMVVEGILNESSKDVYRIVPRAESKFPNMSGPAFNK